MAVKDFAHRAHELVELGLRDVVPLEPGRGDLATELAEGCLPHRVIARREQVQRPAHGPHLDQVTRLPQRFLDRPARQLVDAGPQGQLARREDLRVQAAQSLGDFQDLVGGLQLIQVVLVDPPGQYVRPRQRHLGITLHWSGSVKRLRTRRVWLSVAPCLRQVVTRLSCCRGERTCERMAE